MAVELFEGINEGMFRNPWVGMRRVDWQDRAALEDLFHSESLETQYGTFIDQRFLDYLAANFPEIDDIHWRKFEALTAEFFTREGWDVEIGAGRDDGGIDVRVWPKIRRLEDPPAILVQFKRQRSKIEKVVVKALFADVLEGKATSGLIVTTSALSPGARHVVGARGYPVIEASRGHLRKWLEAMRTPAQARFSLNDVRMRAIIRESMWILNGSLGFICRKANATSTFCRLPYDDEGDHVRSLQSLRSQST